MTVKKTPQLAVDFTSVDSLCKTVSRRPVARNLLQVVVGGGGYAWYTGDLFSHRRFRRYSFYYTSISKAKPTNKYQHNII